MILPTTTTISSLRVGIGVKCVGATGIAKKTTMTTSECTGWCYVCDECHDRDCQECTKEWCDVCDSRHRR